MGTKADTEVAMSMSGRAEEAKAHKKGREGVVEEGRGCSRWRRIEWMWIHEVGFAPVQTCFNRLANIGIADSRAWRVSRYRQWPDQTTPPTRGTKETDLLLLLGCKDSTDRAGMV